MAVSSASFRVVTFLILIIAALMTVASSQVTAPAPAPTSDGISLYSPFHSSFIAFSIYKFQFINFILLSLLHCLLKILINCSYFAGTTIDQAVAYVLMLLALVLTYIMH